MGCSQSTPVQEPVVAAPVSNASGATSGSAPASQTLTAQAPASNVSKASGEAAASSAVSTGGVTAPGSTDKLFTVTGVTITEQGVVYYNFDQTNGGASLKKRYNDFKLLYAKLPNVKLLPALPQANLSTVFRGKHNPALLKEREQQFEAVLNTIGSNAAFASTDAFQSFLVQ